MKSTPIVIVGGGPCGLSLALQLAQRKISCVVFEKKAGLSTHPKAMGISRRSSEIFRQLGVLDALYEPHRHLIEEPGVCLNIFARSFVGEEWGRIPLTEPLSPLSPGPAFHCPQTWTEQVLFDALEKIAPGTVCFNHEVSEVTPADDHVEFIVNGERQRADWLVAADGAGGQIRHELQVGSDGPGDMGHFLNVFFRAKYSPHMKGRHSMLFCVMSEEIIEFFVTVDGDDLWLMHQFLQPGETAADYPAEKLAALIRQASGLPDIPVEVLSISPWVMSPKVSREFRRGRILLAGDAAARMSPSGGLGLNTGLQSVHNLAWKLAAVAQGKASAALLDSYELERHGAALWTMEHTNKNANELWGIIQAAIKQDWEAVRKLVASNGRGGSRLGIDLGIEYPEGALVPDGTESLPREDKVNDYTPNARPGSRAPHFLLKDGRSVLDLFGPGFTLLVVDAIEDAPAECAVHVLGGEPDFASLYGLDRGGCVLVRPDGYVAARWKAAPVPGAVGQVLKDTLYS
jgi:2-polyprenyl-6-methoxyphenol hydroxylase-like FAD-dependent oxidoreductase